MRLKESCSSKVLSVSPFFLKSGIEKSTPKDYRRVNQRSGFL